MPKERRRRETPETRLETDGGVFSVGKSECNFGCDGRRGEEDCGVRNVLVTTLEYRWLDRPRAKMSTDNSRRPGGKASGAFCQSEQGRFIKKPGYTHEA